MSTRASNAKYNFFPVWVRSANLYQSFGGHSASEHITAHTMSATCGYFRTFGLRDDASPMLSMLRVLSSRAPDGAGLTLIDTRSNDRHSEYARGVGGLSDRRAPHDLAIGHCLLQMQKVEALSAQPLWSKDDAFCIAVDGAIYNRAEVGVELLSSGYAMDTSADAEVALAAYRAWGPACFRKFTGFWAIVIYDARQRRVTVARDRVAQAPLYVARTADALWWSSDLAALRNAAGQSNFPVREQAVSDFVAFGTRDRRDCTFYENLTSLPSSSFAQFGKDGEYFPRKYASITKVRTSSDWVSRTDAASSVRQLLTQSVRDQLQADVPVAVELSGGMDSSTLVALAASTGMSVSAFTVTFPGDEADELPFAKMVQQRYAKNVQLHVIEQPPGDLFDTADEYIGAMAEPFHSPNMLANRRIWQAMAKHGVRATLNGVGGDELFASEYIPELATVLKHGQLARFHREAIAWSEDPAAAFSPLYRRRLKKALKYIQAEWFGRMRGSSLNFERADSLAQFGVVLHRPPCARVLGDNSRALVEDMGDGIMNYWMRSSHQSSSTVPIQIRAPFLDPRLIDFAFRLPMDYLLYDGWAKWVLRKAMEDLLPKEIVWRARKMGFPFPWKPWLKRSRPRVEKLLHGLDCPYVRPKQFLAGYDAITHSDPKQLWRVISVLLWWKKCVLGMSLQDLSD
jgi:asparagine synthase (glutamine-hydrolysing)